MNKKITGIVVAIFIVIGTTILFLSLGSGAIVDRMATGREVMALRLDQKCSFTKSTATMKTAGTVYFSKGKIRGDVSVYSNSQTFKSYIISDGVDVYTWSSNSSTGVKSPVTTGVKSDPSDTAFDLDDQVGYDCSAWNPDGKVFVVPSDINFIVVTPPPLQASPTSAGSESGTATPASSLPPPTASEIKSRQCGSCDALEDATKRSQCRTAFSCN